MPARKIMGLNEIVMQGIKGGVDRHWRYAKDLLRVKPEYLLTISVADEVANSGFGETCGLDISLKLEESTHRLVGHLWMHGAGIKRYFKERGAWLGRRGKVDILVQHEFGNDCHIIELKNFDPSAPEVKKELKRFVDLIEINGGVNPLKSCHLGFPSTTNRRAWLEKQIKGFTLPFLRISVESCYELSGEDPEDGMPAYYCNVVSVARAQT